MYTLQEAQEAKVQLQRLAEQDEQLRQVQLYLNDLRQASRSSSVVRLAGLVLLLRQHVPAGGPRSKTAALGGSASRAGRAAAPDVSISEQSRGKQVDPPALCA